MKCHAITKLANSISIPMTVSAATCATMISIRISTMKIEDQIENGMAYAGIVLAVAFLAWCAWCWIVPA